MFPFVFSGRDKDTKNAIEVRALDFLRAAARKKSPAWVR